MSEQNAKSKNNPKSSIYCVGTQMVVTDKELEILSAIRGIETKEIDNDNIELTATPGFLNEEGLLLTEEGVSITKFSKKEVKKLLLRIKEKMKKKKERKK